jgi:hypothetical protein
MWVDALSRFLCGCGGWTFTRIPRSPLATWWSGTGDYTRTFSPGEVVALAATLLTLGVHGRKRPPPEGGAGR